MRISSDITHATERAAHRLSQLTGIGKGAGTAPHAAATISASVSIAEMRIDEMIDALIEAHPHTNSDFGSYVVERSRSGFHHTWSSRIEVLRRGFRVSPASETVSQKFDQLVDVRNAIAHGDGHLTTLQTSRTAAGIDLRRNIEKTFGIVVAGRKLHLNPMAGMIGTRVARDYLLAVDVEYSKALLQIGR